MHADCGADLTDIHMHLFRELRPDFLYFIQEIGAEFFSFFGIITISDGMIQSDIANPDYKDEI